MAASVIDALIVTLGLDASKFQDGTKKVTGDLRKVSGAGDATAKDMELAAKKITAGFARVRTEILGLFALLMAGRGIKQLAADITTGDAAAGRLAKTLDMSTAELAAWQGAAVRAGGTAAGIATSFSSMSQKLEEFELTGKGDTTFLSTLNMLHVSLRDGKGQLKSFGDVFLDLADKMKGMDPRRATAIGAMLGLDQGTVNLLEQGRAAVQALLDEQKKLGVPSDADAKRAQQVLNRLHDLQQAFESFGRTVLNEVTPAITGLMTQLTAWIEKNGPRLKTEITDKIEQFVKYLQTVDWSAVGANIEALATQAKAVADALGGVVHVTEILFGLWVGAKFLGVLGNVVKFRAALAGIAADQALKAVDPGDKMGSWIDRNIPGAGAVDDWFARHFGIGRTYEQQHQAAGPTTEEQKMLSAQAMAFFTAHGWTPEQASGIVGNLQQESGFNAAAGRGTAHQGIAQWSADRQADIEKHFGKSLISMSYAEQLEAVQWELTQGKYKAVGDQLRNAKSARGAAGIVDHFYESPGNYLWEDGRRGSNAEQRLSEFTGSPASTSPSQVNYVPTAGQRWGATTNHVNHNDNSSDVRIGTVNVTTQATDANGIAAGLRTAIANTSFAMQMNRGIA